MTKHFLFKTAIAIAFFASANGNVYAQRLDSLLNKLDTSYPQEKVYLHFDRSYYNQGETVWFKAYLTSANLPSHISNTLYAELIDDKGHILQRKTMPVVAYGAASSFTLPDTVRSSLLYARAYTSWMLNFDSSLLYLKPIRIITNANTIKKNPVETVFNLQFFPEGGDLVAGVNSRVAFKANNQDGLPFHVSGDIVDADGNKQSPFSSTHDGMGYFSFTPLLNEKYKAVWKDKKGVLHETPLPTAKRQGVVLSIDNMNGQTTYTLTRPDSAEEPFTFFYVVAQMQQQLMYSAQINMREKTTVTAPLVTDSLPDGIMQVTVFNADQIPVAERIFFINHANYYFITDLHAAEKNLNKRGHNVLQVDVGGNLLSNLSISVTDAALNTPLNNDENIFSQLLLTSDIKGYVYNPAYYFSSDEDSLKQQLDLVMMTNGWRRFKWEDLIANKWPQINNLPENYLSITGEIYGLAPYLLRGKDIAGIIKPKTGGVQLVTIPIANDGQFKLSGLYFFDTAKVYYQLSNDKDKDLTTAASFSFNSGFVRSPDLLVNQLHSLYAPDMPDSNTAKKNKVFSNLARQQIIEGSRVKMLDVVVVKSHEKSIQEKMDEQYTSGLFSGGDAIIFTTEGDPFATSGGTVLSYLEGKVAGLQVSAVGGGSVSWRGGTPDIFLDEMNTDLSEVQSIPLTDVAMIKIFRPPFFGASGGGPGGAIAVYTKKGKRHDDTVKGLDFANINGYSSIKEFYSPDYSKYYDPTLKDYRTTLYWNPFLLMDKDTRRVMIPFYNSDGCKKIRVVIEGINEAGQLTREEKYFE